MSYSIEFLIEDFATDARLIISEIDDLVKYCGRKPSHVTLYPEQFEHFKRSTQAAEEKQMHRKAKQDNNGERLKNGTMKHLMAKAKFSNISTISELSYKGITIKR
jgi:hypothetical protein